ncbi:hypothetical protein DFH11DRAFT_1548918 [Phellopilus nigrolimitatus]|nr:hypothetical protein DFH11DRAFT_1548918 [Phellopilus nigrolimitatus]
MVEVERSRRRRSRKIDMTRTTVLACQVQQAETTQHKYCGAARFSRSPSTSKAFGAARSLPVLDHPQRYTGAYDPDEAAALLDSDEGCAIAKTSLVVDELLVRARGGFAAEGERARARSLSRKSAGRARPIPPAADANGRRDRDALLVILELEKHARENGFGSCADGSFIFMFQNIAKLQNGLLDLIKLYFERFDDKACCFEDFKPYTVLEGSELLALNAYLDGHNISDTEPTLCRSTNVQKLRLHILGAGERETVRALVYLRAYTAALGLGGALPETEQQPADDLVLAAQTFVGLWGAQICSAAHCAVDRVATLPSSQSCDLTLTQECVEASQFYFTSSSKISEVIVRAFVSEKYLQHDLVKIEHMRMRLAHEGPSTELADTELIDLKFIFY